MRYFGSALMMASSLLYLGAEANADSDERTVSGGSKQNSEDVAITLLNRDQTKVALPVPYFDILKNASGLAGEPHIQLRFRANFNEYSDKVDYRILVAPAQSSFSEHGKALVKRVYDDEAEKIADFREKAPKGTDFSLDGESASLDFVVPIRPKFVGASGVRVGVRVATASEVHKCRPQFSCKDLTVDFIKPNIKAEISASTEKQTALLRIKSANVPVEVYARNIKREKIDKYESVPAQSNDSEKTDEKLYKINPVGHNKVDDIRMKEFETTIVPNYDQNIFENLEGHDLLEDDVRKLSAATPKIEPARSEAQRTAKHAKKAVSKFRDAQSVVMTNQECDAVRVKPRKNGTNVRRRPNEYDALDSSIKKGQFGRRTCYGAVNGTSDYTWYIISTDPWKFVASAAVKHVKKD